VVCQRDGRFAVVNPCRWRTIGLYADEEEARRDFEYFQRIPCTGGCNPDIHSLFDLKSGKCLAGDGEYEL